MSGLIWGILMSLRSAGAFSARLLAIGLLTLGSVGAFANASSATTNTPEGCPNTYQDNSNGGGANGDGPYDSTCDGSPSSNGNDDDNGNQPCAGCVGNADDQNPPGQGQGGGDNNQGYECDGNQG